MVLPFYTILLKPTYIYTIVIIAWLLCCMNYITGFELVYRKFDETTGELLDTLRTSCGKQVATPGSTRYSAASTSSLILQTKTIAPIMLSVSSEVIGEGVFGVCRKAYLQGTLVCVKELKDKSIQSKSAVLQEA